MKEYKGVILNVFVTLLVLTFLFFLYKQINPYLFPGLEYRLLWATSIFGLLTFIFYFTEIARILSSRSFKRAQEFLTNLSLKLLRKVLSKTLRREKALPKKNYTIYTSVANTIKNTREKLERSFEHAQEYKKVIRNKFMEHVCKKTWIHDFEQLSRKLVLLLIQAKDLIVAYKLESLAVFVSAVILYLLIVWLASLKLSWEEYAFFIMLAYIPLSLKLNLDSRLPIIAALFLLALCPVLLIQNLEEHANRVATFAYYSLVIGVILALIEYRRSGDENNRED
jgi:hypothetical protein